MSLAQDPGLQGVEEALCLADLPPTSGVLVAYVLLTEWVAADGETYLVESRPEGQTYWRSLGLIEAARMSIDHGVRASQQDDDEDDG